MVRDTGNETSVSEGLVVNVVGSKIQIGSAHLKYVLGFLAFFPYRPLTTRDLRILRAGFRRGHGKGKCILGLTRKWSYPTC
jgi:hypothetical protein